MHQGAKCKNKDINKYKYQKKMQEKTTGWKSPF